MILWQQLRGRRFCGLKFYRQFGIGRYVLDFYCEELKLAIELDGGHHSELCQIEYDADRTAFIEANEIRVIRFWNNEIFENLEGVMNRLLEIVGEYNSPSFPPLPREGGVDVVLQNPPSLREGRES